jgi:integrase
MSLRIKDIDFSHQQIVVRDTKGHESRVTMLPNTLAPFLLEHLQRVRSLHERDLQEGYGSVYLPFALDRKYPNTDRQWIWQYVFPSIGLSKDPRSGTIYMKVDYKKPSSKQYTKLKSIKKLVAIPFVIASQLIYSKMATISAQSKNSWVTKMSKLP